MITIIMMTINILIILVIINNTVKPLNSRHLRVLKIMSVIERCLLLGGNFKKIVTVGTKCFQGMSAILGCPLLGGFTVVAKEAIINK